MSHKKLPEDFVYLADMYNDDYFPKFLVDKLKGFLKEVVQFIEQGTHTTEEIQQELDKAVLMINEMEDEFNENDSEIETAARESIGETVENILSYFEIGIDTETAIRMREW